MPSEFADACRLLGVPTDATIEQAEDAYRSLAKVVHPDVGGDAETFVVLTEAWRAFRAHHETPAPRPVTPPPAPASHAAPTASTAPSPRKAAAERRRADLRWRVAVFMGALVAIVVLRIFDQTTTERPDPLDVLAAAGYEDIRLEGTYSDVSCPPGAGDASSFVATIQRPVDERAADGRYRERGVVCFHSTHDPAINVIVREPIIPAQPSD